MKKLTLTAFLLTVFAGAYTQNYWVVETKGKTAKESIVKVYDENNTLVNETKIDRLIDINKRKERRRLNRKVKNTSPVLWSKR